MATARRRVAHGLTTREHQVLEYYKKYQKANKGAHPTLKQIADYLQCWPNNALHLVRSLEAMGFIVNRPRLWNDKHRAARGLPTTDRPTTAVRLKVGK